MITLHPTILYYRDDDNDLSHKSFVFVSEVLHHNAAMVTAIVDRIMNVAKKLVSLTNVYKKCTDIYHEGGTCRYELDLN